MNRRTCIHLCSLTLLMGAALWIAANLAGRGFSEQLEFLLYLETGQRAALLPRQTEPPAQPSVPPTVPTQPTEAAAETPVFSQAALDEIAVKYGCDYRPDLQALLCAPLSWQLRQDAPTVLIYHTHTTESYTQTELNRYKESSAYRTLAEDFNMLRVGDELAARLEASGIHVLHDRTLHDYPAYNGAYGRSQQTVRDALAENPGICLVLDLHRDAVEVNGRQMDTACQVGGLESAQIMLVVGTDAGGLYHPDWQQNLGLALKLSAELESLAPGITRPISLRSERFNQNESPGALLVEVGAAGNTLEEALRAVDVLADAICALADGANREAAAQ